MFSITQHIEEPFIDCISSYGIAVNTTSEALSTSGSEELNTTFPSLVAVDHEVVVVPTNILGAGESTNFAIGWWDLRKVCVCIVVIISQTLSCIEFKFEEFWVHNFT